MRGTPRRKRAAKTVKLVINPSTNSSLTRSPPGVGRVGSAAQSAGHAAKLRPHFVPIGARSSSENPRRGFGSSGSSGRRSATSAAGTHSMLRSATPPRRPWAKAESTASPIPVPLCPDYALHPLTGFPPIETRSAFRASPRLPAPRGTGAACGLATRTSPAVSSPRCCPFRRSGVQLQPRSHTSPRPPRPEPTPSVRWTAHRQFLVPSRSSARGRRDGKSTEWWIVILRSSTHIRHGTKLLAFRSDRPSPGRPRCRRGAGALPPASSRRPMGDATRMARTKSAAKRATLPKGRRRKATGLRPYAPGCTAMAAGLPQAPSF